MKLLDLQYVNTIEEALVALLEAPNALDYDKQELMSNYVRGTSEAECLGLELCGTSGVNLVLNLINKGTYELEFVHNVAFNSERSIPLIVRVLNLFLINWRK